MTSWLSPSVQAGVSALNLYDQTAFGGAFRLGPEPALGNNRSVKEMDETAFVQADFDLELASIPVRGNVGVRTVTTDQTANGFTFVSGAPRPISVSRSYEDTLPSANIVVEPFENFLVRFGASKVMARPDLGSLTPGATVSVSGSTRSVTAGNPNLDPFRAKAYDLSFEWYFKRGSLLSLALFTKDIDSLVQTVTTNTTFTGNPFGLPDSLAVAACGTAVGCSPSANWAFSTPVNTTGGELKGFEVNFQHDLDFLPGPLKHTGVLLNYTGVESRVNYVNGAGAVVARQSLTGLSPHSYNATLYYEHGPLSARVSAAYRARFYTRVPGQESGTAFDGTNATYNVDASAQYSLNDRLKLTFEGINLTDDFQDQFNGASNLVSVYHHTGSTYLFGVRYSY